jgi:hypothetical protein
MLLLLLLLLLLAASISSHFSALRTHIFKPIKRSSTIIMVTSCYHIRKDCCKIFLVDNLPTQDHTTASVEKNLCIIFNLKYKED